VIELSVRAQEITLTSYDQRILRFILEKPATVISWRELRGQFFLISQHFDSLLGSLIKKGLVEVDEDGVWATAKRKKLKGRLPLLPLRERRVTV